MSGAVRTQGGGWQINLALVTLVVGIVTQALVLSYQLGQLTTKVENNISRITALEAVNLSRVMDDRRRDERGARIEAKLDQLVPGGEREAHP